VRPLPPQKLSLSLLVSELHYLLHSTKILCYVKKNDALLRHIYPQRISESYINFGTGVLHLIQINHQPDVRVFEFIILTFVYSSTCFGRFPAHHQELNDCSGSLWFYHRIVVIAVLCSWSGRPARPRTQHRCQHDTKVKPEAATAVNELQMMGAKTPETC
jgi:hypothetical protein